MKYCELNLSRQWLDTVYCEENFSDFVFVKFLNPLQSEGKIYCYTLHITNRTLENKDYFCIMKMNSKTWPRC
ncbi:AIF_collapsed_G0001110.mRNA.1.CDS.1 [Saccharomyces cerevisiae]|nr:CNB_1a_G0000930.mRNA.1.CDS.1 [Saccharomyces cerevisiae]CAI4244319.1 AEH_G0000920.mRNA.1.CDS.1 [Saccharomyces cerevisiae]CAI4246659.1 CRB_1a_G0001040.mRNA.1.CDS.1 [Saccharomyces cerevisiae]CAI4247566.1 ACH_G0000940.mRNA.1.CDS.1 [Saccharomyces cerevisiae]CAI4378264.1 BHH_G0025610.mRNA.1.CDS.1 [Saccharomyces cerevisiae]